MHAEVRANYLASPPLVVAYALAGRIDLDLTRDPLGHDPAGHPVFLKDLWPTQREVADTIERALDARNVPRGLSRMSTPAMKRGGR